MTQLGDSQQELSQNAQRVEEFLRSNGTVVDTADGIARRFGWNPVRTRHALDELKKHKIVETVGEAPWYKLVTTRATESIRPATATLRTTPVAG